MYSIDTWKNSPVEYFVGTLVCRDDDNGIGTFCEESTDVIVKSVPPATNSSSLLDVDDKDGTTSTMLSAFTKMDKDGTTVVCSSIYGMDNRYCVTAELKEGCAIGYRGSTCAGCAKGYAREGPTGCAKCGEPSKEISTVSVGLIVGCSLYTFLIISTLSALGDLTRGGIIMRVISSNILVVSLFKDLEMDWPAGIISPMNLGSVAGDPVSLLNMECLFYGAGSTNR